MLLNGACSCGKTKYVIEPGGEDGSDSATALTLSAYCHCTSCQKLNGAPFIWTTHWSKEAIRWIVEDYQPVRYQVPEKTWKYKLRCKDCGSPLGSWNEKKAEWTIYPPTLERDKSGRIIGSNTIRPTAHQFYTTRLVNLDQDGLTKWEEYEGKSREIK